MSTPTVQDILLSGIWFMQWRVDMQMSDVQEVFQTRAEEPEAGSLVLRLQARACEGQQRASQQIVPRDTLLEGTALALVESCRPVQHEVSQTAFFTTPSKLPLGPRHALPTSPRPRKRAEHLTRHGPSSGGVGASRGLPLGPRTLCSPGPAAVSGALRLFKAPDTLALVRPLIA